MSGDAKPEDPAAARPYYRLLGLRAEDGEPAGRSKLRLDSRAELENGRGDIHGGVVASLLDAALAVAVRSAYSNGEGAATVSLTVNFLQPGRGSLIATGHVVRAGRTLASAEASVTDVSGRVVAHAVGTMRILGRDSSEHSAG